MNMITSLVSKYLVSRKAIVCMKCRPLNLTHTSMWSLPTQSSWNEH